LYVEELNMKVVFFGAALLFASASASFAEDWMVRVASGGRVCHVQIKTAAPIGRDLKGPFPNRTSACKEALALYDIEMSNTTKCWAYGGGTKNGCAKDGVDLP
jgi:hypothetical protein